MPNAVHEKCEGRGDEEGEPPKDDVHYGLQVAHRCHNVIERVRIGGHNFLILNLLSVLSVD